MQQRSYLELPAEKSPMNSLGDCLLLDVFCGLATHAVYNKFEVDPANIPATALLLLGVPAIPGYLLALHMGSASLAVVLAFGVFYATLAASIVLYRISPLHPLARYPGPFWLKISKFATMYHALNGKQYSFFKGLHDKYGPFVRVGPNEVSIVDATAIIPVLGADGMRRGPQWDAHNVPGTTPNLVALRDVDLHHERRKLWNRGFTTSALKELRPTVESRVVELVSELGKRTSPKSRGKGVPVDLAQWLANFTYDFMGDLVFAGGFDLMRDGDMGGIRRLLEGNIKVIGILQHVPWVTGIVHKLSSVPEEQLKFREYGAKCYDKRKQSPGKRDLFYYITNEDRSENIKVSREQGLNEIFAAIIGGADTTSTVMAGLFYYLLSNLEVLNKLQKEVDAYFPAGEGEPFDPAKLAGMPYLNAVINETLRLQPPLLTSLQRCPVQGRGGKMVAGRFIPENAAVYIPLYILHRDPRYFFPFPELFIPERWLDQESEKFKTDTSAYIPFSAGPANCVGKNLALLEMRMVVSAVLQRFDLKFPDSYDTKRWEEELKDYFILKVGELPVVLNLRE